MPTPPPFSAFAGPGPFATNPLREAITDATRRPEQQLVPRLLDAARMPDDMAERAQVLARKLAAGLRERERDTGRAGLVQGLLQEYALSSQEGVALMCLAEALLRIPDPGTRDALIRDKVAHGQWQSHLGRSPSLFVNAATWGLLVTGRLVATHSESGLTSAIARIVARGGEPLVRKGVDLAMRMMGEQFVAGETIAQALEHAKAFEAKGFRYSFDMLGEAALTAHDAQRYLAAYEAAIHAIGRAGAHRGVIDGNGISIKLSALHPRYSRAQLDRVLDELYPVLVRLCALAKRYDIGLNIDAEEADRLEISLDLLEMLAFEPQLAGWAGLGFVVQAYQKRCFLVVGHVIDIARRSGRRLMVRLVKGAYWDTEIKRAQVDGQDGYPVFTRKPSTDISYIACAKKLLAAPDAVYPQFATHNAHTVAAIHELADPARFEPGQYEFQCLHGMGEPLYEQVAGPIADGKLGRPCRIYAPVGTHETLLAYLVRRLLENGANTSFVHRIADTAVTVEDLVRDPVDIVDALAREEGGAGLPHPAIPLPRELYGSLRKNSRGMDLANEKVLRDLQAGWHPLTPLSAGPLLAPDSSPPPAGSSPPRAGSSPPPPGFFPPPPGEGQGGGGAPIANPADHTDIVGHVLEATPTDIDAALAAAEAALPHWTAIPPFERAVRLCAAADAIEADMPRLMGILIREAGKSAANAVAEVREAVDFLRYYAAQVRTGFDNAMHKPLGPVVCISPWNFPLAIFLGQVSAALAAGNTVLAKPAEQTPLIAAEAVRALWGAGVPQAAVQLLPGRGETVGAQLVADPRVKGVLFTGSTQVARILQRTLAGRTDARGRAIPLIAETGGQNAMLVDSSALAEQVVQDVLTSAFDSAGQRCSALRVLCLQEEVADRVVDMLLGAMAELRVGNPARLAVDVGPVIDEEARGNILRHIDQMRARGRRVVQVCAPNLHPLDGGTHVLPTVIELESLAELEREVFGPVLHVVRFRRDDLEGLLAQVNATGYGLTLGLHTRIDETIARVLRSAHAGNVYVNRNMVGAVVGVQPFGGEGLSGTGPKAGGPLYLYRLLSERPDDVLPRCFPSPSGGAPAPSSPSPSGKTPARSFPSPSGGGQGGGAAGAEIDPALSALLSWLPPQHPDLLAPSRRYAQLTRTGHARLLPGPTGERNTWSLVPRTAILCLASSDADRLLQLAAVLASGSRAVWPPDAQPLLRRLPPDVQSRIQLAADWSAPTVAFDGVLLHGSVEELAHVQRVLARREGPVIAVERLDPGDAAIPLERLVVERAVSINTAAAGGNATLMTLA